jgi:hypothetical protein
MRYQLKIFPNSKQSQVKVCGASQLEIRTPAKAVSGAANTAVIKLLAHHFSCKKSQIFIISGHKSRQKTIEVML